MIIGFGILVVIFFAAGWRKMRHSRLAAPAPEPPSVRDYLSKDSTPAVAEPVQAPPVTPEPIPDDAPPIPEEYLSEPEKELRKIFSKLCRPEPTLGIDRIQIQQFLQSQKN